MSNQKLFFPYNLGESRKQFLINKEYNDYVFQKEYFPYQFDSWYDKKLYGLVNNQKNAIYPKNSVLAFNSNTDNFSYKNLIFVVDAFKDMRSYHQSLQSADKFTNNNSIYLNLEIKEATKNIDDVYLEYLKFIYSIFFSSYLVPIRKQKITNFNSFLDVFISFLKTVAPIAPITRSSFIKNRACDPRINGLIIDFESKTSTITTLDKANKYVSDPNFEIFVDSARRFGFYVDRNNPWRIIADLESPIMKDYYKRYKFYSVDDVFANCYHVAHYIDLNELKNLIIAFWNTFAKNEGMSLNVKQKEKCSALFVEENELKQLDVQVFEKTYGINWLIRLYIFLKIHEYKISINQNNFEIIYTEAIKINQYINEKNCIDYINRKIQELIGPDLGNLEQLTSPEEIVKMLSLMQSPIFSEGISF